VIFASFHQGKEGLKNSLSPSFVFSLNTLRVSRLACPGLDPGTRSYRYRNVIAAERGNIVFFF
jgi:hypothetical protein